MEPLRSPWRVSDVVAYDELREAANALIAALLRQARTGEAGRAESLKHSADIRGSVLAVDGYDRTAIDAARAEMDALRARLSDARR